MLQLLQLNLVLEVLDVVSDAVTLPPVGQLGDVVGVLQLEDVVQGLIRVALLNQLRSLVLNFGAGKLKLNFNSNNSTLDVMPEAIMLLPHSRLHSAEVE